MRRVVFLALLLLALPLAAFANSQIDFTNSGGTLSGTTSSLSLSNSILIAVNGFDGLGLVTGSNLGTFTFQTGALTGSLTMGGTFAGGGSFQITGNGTNGLPNGVIFSGTFSGPGSWVLNTLPNGTHNYTFSGIVSGMLGSVSTQGVTVQLTINTGMGLFNGESSISSGDTNLNFSVPEPGTLGLLGTGLVGVAGLLRRKIRIG